ncbi:MAG: TolC family protein, partial [Acidobacteria bacterium]|nr:TolC family protein [Acidobacteriota bacterium]
MLAIPAVEPAFAQQPVPSSSPVPQGLTLEAAIGIAEARSEQIAIAQFGVARALAGQKRARSEKLPQVSGSASYDRTLKSEFSGLFDGESAQPACDPFVLDPSKALDARVAEIERALDCGAVGSPFAGGGFSDLPFGRANTWRVNLSIAQALYAGGRIAAQEQVANVGRSIAEDSVRSARAQLVIDVTQAFYDAALADRLVTIAEATLAQAEATLAQVELAHRAGRIPEFELLRARVARDNQRPALIRAKAQRTVAYLRFRQLLEIPVGEPVSLAADLDDPRLPPEPRFVAPLAEILAGDRVSMTDDRLVVRQIAGSVRISEEGLTIARSQRLPYVSVNSALGGVNYDGAPGFDAWRANWTLGAYVSMPLFTG